MAAERPAANQPNAVPADRSADASPAASAETRPPPRAVEPKADGRVALRPPEAEEAENRPNRLLELVGQFWAWLFLLVLVLFFSVTGKGFFDLFNFQAMGANVAIMLIMALGQTFVIISGGIDLSTGFVMGLASVGAALAMARLGNEPPLALVVLAGLGAALLAGLAAGLVNGVLIARLRVPPFIGTLGMYGIARGAGFILSGGQPVSVQVRGLGQVGNGYLLYYYPGSGL